MSATTVAPKAVEVALVRPPSGPFPGLVRIGEDAYAYLAVTAGVLLQKQEGGAEHTVAVRGGVPVGCSCRDREYRPWRKPGCKHMVAVYRLLAMGG